MEAENGKHLLLANSPGGFAAAGVRLLDDGNLQADLSREGYERVREHFTWGKIEAEVQVIVEAPMAWGRFTKNGSRAIAGD